MTDPARAQLRERLREAADYWEGNRLRFSRQHELVPLLREAISEAPAPATLRQTLELDGPEPTPLRVAGFLRQYAGMIRKNERWDLPETMANAYESAALSLEKYHAEVAKPAESPVSGGTPRRCQRHGPLPGLRYCPECASSGEPWTDAQADAADASPLVRTEPAQEPADEWFTRAAEELFQELGLPAVTHIDDDLALIDAIKKALRAASLVGVRIPQDQEPLTRGGNQAAVERLQSAAASPEVLSARDAEDNVLSSPMAAALLLQLKAECEAQHSRAETAESELAVERALCQSWRTRALEYLADLNALRLSHDHNPTASETERASKP